MNYDGDSFISLLEEVERQGGEHLPETCLPQEYVITINKRGGGVKKRKVFTTGCGKELRLSIPYDPGAPVLIPVTPTAANPDPEPERRDGDHGAGRLIVCAEDDAVDRWPRFLKATPA